MKKAIVLISILFCAASLFAQRYTVTEKQVEVTNEDGEKETQTHATVKDNLTGLVWTKDYKFSVKWDEASAYCENLDYAGLTNWRLPDIKELISLVKIDNPKGTAVTDFPAMPKEGFWSKTMVKKDPNSAWDIKFMSGMVSKDSMHNRRYNARCVLDTTKAEK